MSQDLFAAFGNVNSEPPKTQPGHEKHPPFSFFDDFKLPDANQSPPQQPFTRGFGSSQPQKFHVADQNEDEDEFGDFEDAEHTSGAIITSEKASSNIWNDSFNTTTRPSSEPWTSPGAEDSQPNTILPHLQVKDSITSKSPPAKRNIIARDPNVLFDASDEEDLEDNFGDFEDPLKSSNVVAQRVPDLLGLDEPNNNMNSIPSEPQLRAQSILPPVASLLDLEALNLPSTPKQRPETKLPPVASLLDLEALNMSGPPSPSTRTNTTRRNPPTFIHFRQSSSLQLASRGRSQESSVWDSELSPPISPPGFTRSNIQPTIVAPTKQGEEPWDDFNAWDQPASPPLSSRPPVTKAPAESSSLSSVKPEEPWDDFNAWEQETPGPAANAPPSLTKSPQPLPTTKLQDSTPDELPPSNIPPPAVLLSLFSEIFTAAEVSFFKPTSSQPPAVRNQIYASPETVRYLEGLIAIATVCGRIIAGRKLRWKRDTLLSQSMRIGPACSGKNSGMKVTSIDKSETAKEDREVADVIRAWQAQVGRLKSALVEVKKAGASEMGHVPELGEVMPVRTAKEVEGGVPGFKACVFCGLKREERVAKVDFDVMDSFGEWWLEKQNMHRACRNFWEEHKESLRSK
ncbi:hypothetical protein EJ08DRAFT_698968 [Tothia fuscella]|uniref:Uncharacterized protein n=1 Tax=Tothia fuscella TaxID=1048955 RepID=A0A9P4NNR5_9PEZI|nr:hypothetical protein EJ08DRAFT_698968 [Tothia fuscella]